VPLFVLASRFDDFEWGVSAVTLGELRLGVLQAENPEAAPRRLSTYQLHKWPMPRPSSAACTGSIRRRFGGVACGQQDHEPAGRPRYPAPMRL
jgi:predicted nucleic acid-binding protein